jgi:hypothetical protein
LSQSIDMVAKVNSDKAVLSILSFSRQYSQILIAKSEQT